MSYKIQYVSEFINEINRISLLTQKILNKTEQNIKNYNIQENINNPYKTYYISNIKITNNEFNTEYASINPSYSFFNAEQMIDVEMDKNDIIHTSYYENAFNYLNKIFILNDTLKVVSFWRYENKKSGFTENEIPSVWWVKNNYFLNKDIFINTLKIINTDTSIMTINNASKYLNRKTNDSIETIVKSIKQDDKIIYKQGVLSTDKVVEVKCKKITTSNKCNKLLNEDNCNFLLKRDLSNLTDKVILSDDIVSDENVLSKNKIESLLDSYKDKDDYIVDGDFCVDNSYNDDHIINAISFFELLQTKIQNYLENIIDNYIANGVQAKNPLELYYQSKIKEYKDKYILLNSYTITGIKTLENNCFQLNNPLTLLGENNYCNNVNIEKSNKALTKGVYKRWLLHMIKGKIQW